MSAYSEKFFAYISRGVLESAGVIVPLLRKSLTIGSVLDVGCGQGAWLKVWKEHGVGDYLGIDGGYVTQLFVEEDMFLVRDLKDRFSLDLKFDLVQSLEVAEHLPEESATGFVESLVKHGNIVFFSAAPRGQGGHSHINEQEYDYWKRLFEDVNYVALDYVRPMIIDNKNVKEWYRYNSFLFVSKEIVDSLPAELQDAVVFEGESLRDVSPFLVKMRKRLVRLFPSWLQTGVSRIIEYIVITLAKSDGASPGAPRPGAPT